MIELVFSSNPALAPRASLKAANSRAASRRARLRTIFYALKQKPHTVVELTVSLRIADPRSEIRYLRDLGVRVADRRIYHRNDGGAHKQYWIEAATPLPPELQEPQDPQSEKHTQ